jgi:hypothetical protein
VMECKEFNSLLHTPIESLSLMARRGDNWAPIPFQIDQKKPLKISTLVQNSF